jgi:hypothetical protein
LSTAKTATAKPMRMQSRLTPAILESFRSLCF